MDMSSVRSESGTAYLMFQKLRMKECMRVRSNITLDAEWTEEDAKNQRNRVEKSIRFLFSATGDSKRAKNTVPILLCGNCKT